MQFLREHTGAREAHIIVDAWPAADTVVWLDLARRTSFPRAIQRSARRVLTKQRLWNGDREQFGVLRPRSLKRLWNSLPGYGDRIEALLQEPDFSHLAVIRLRSPRDARRLLLTLPTG